MKDADTVLGFGRHTADWFESAPAPENDGEVLVIQIDSKASPTATDKELAKRRGKRVVNPHRGSQRHRCRASRKRRGSKKRRKKGDKAKNGKMATIVVIYTLKQADKRGFTKESGKTVQIVTDGDNDLARYIGDFSPDALHTIDVFHVVEYLWEAAGCPFKEGSDELIE